MDGVVVWKWFLSLFFFFELHYPLARIIHISNDMKYKTMIHYFWQRCHSRWKCINSPRVPKNSSERTSIRSSFSEGLLLQIGHHHSNLPPQKLFWSCSRMFRILVRLRSEPQPDGQDQEQNNYKKPNSIDITSYLSLVLFSSPPPLPPPIAEAASWKERNDHHVQTLTLTPNP